MHNHQDSTTQIYGLRAMGAGELVRKDDREINFDVIVM